MEDVATAEVEETRGLCAESVYEDQVPAVGQQTEVGDESDSDEEDEDVVSSLTGFSNPESCTGRSETETRPQFSGNCDTRAGTTDLPHSNVSPDSVQQEEAVTTSSDSFLSIVSREKTGRGKTEALSVTGRNEAPKQGGICNLVNYDSSDSDDSSVKTPTIENLEEQDGQVFQYPDSNSKTVEYEGQTDAGQGSGGTGDNEQTGGNAQQTEGGDQDGGYWNEDGCWVDSQGQVWQPPEGYWQQDWTQGTEGQEGAWQGYGVAQGTGCDSQAQQWQSESAQSGQEWVAQGEGQSGRVGEVGGFSGQQQLGGNGSTSTSTEQQQYDRSTHQDRSGRHQQANSANVSAHIHNSSVADVQNVYPQTQDSKSGQHEGERYAQSHNYSSSNPTSYDSRGQQHAQPCAYPEQSTYGHYHQQGGENQQQQQDSGPVQYNQQDQYHSYNQGYYDQQQSYQNSSVWGGYQSHGGGWNYGDNSSWYQQQPAGDGWRHDTQSYNQHHGFEHTQSGDQRPGFAPGDPPHRYPEPSPNSSAPYAAPSISPPPPSPPHYSPHTGPPPHPPPSHLPTPPPPPPPHPPPHLSTPPLPAPPPPPPTHYTTSPPHLSPSSNIANPPLPPLPPPSRPRSLESGRADGDYSHSTSPRPSRQHHHSSHSNTSWRKWKYYRRERSHARSPRYSSSGVPSSPANSVSSDVSSTSRDCSPTPVTQSPVAEGPDHSENRRPGTKTVFSHQLRDPRRSSPPVPVREKSPSTKYNSSSSNLTNKKTTSQKQPSGSSTSSCVSGKEIEQKKVDKTENKDSGINKKQSATEPSSFPKSSLSGFRIPKHSEKGKSQGENPSTAAKNTAPPTKAIKKEGKTKTGADSNSTQAKSSVGTSSASVETVSSKPSGATVVAIAESKTKEPVDEAVSIPEAETDSSHGPTPQQDLVSLFKSIDSSTLSALASTIQLALSSSSGNDVKLSTNTEEKVPLPSTTTTVETVECKDGVKQPTLPANNAEVKEMPTATGDTTGITPLKMKTEVLHVKQEAANSIVDTEKEDIKDKDKSEDGSAKHPPKKEPDKVIRKEVTKEQDVLPNTQTNPKAFGVGPPRRVIATVLSTSMTPPVGHSKKSRQLTVCIPIHKEVTLHVKSTKGSPKTVEEKMSDGDVTKTMDTDKPLEEINTEEIVSEEKQPADNKSADIISPTLSLLKAQDLMFDPKFMYKEYNLRRVRKQEVSPEQSKPQKKKKLDKTSPASKGKDKEHDSKEKDGEAQRSDTIKRGRDGGDMELGCEPPEPKKTREDAKEVEAKANTCAESEEQENCTGVKQKSVKRLLDFSLSVPRRSSPPLPPTLTQLLSMSKNNEQNQNSKPAPHSPTKETQRKPAVKTGGSVTKGAANVAGGPENRLSGRPQLICSLCTLKGGVSNLGFLFGPYFYHLDTESNVDSSTTSNGGSKMEVWLHEDCAVWASGICLVGRELQGLKEALSDASKMICTACKRPGATLFCASRGCKNMYHFPCAIEKGCVLMEDHFQTHCPKHKDTHVQTDS